jgi:hypothetical protein
MRPTDTKTRSYVLAIAFDKLARGWQRFAHDRRHPNPDRGAADWLANKRLEQELAENRLAAGDERGEPRDDTRGSSVGPGIVDRLLVGHAALDCRRVGRRQVLGRGHHADPEAGAADSPN